MQGSMAVARRVQKLSRRACQMSRADRAVGQSVRATPILSHVIFRSLNACVAPTSQHPPITPNRPAIAHRPARRQRLGRFACIRFLAPACALYLLAPIASQRVSASMRLASKSVTGPSLGVAKMEDRKRPAMSDRDETAPPAKRQATLSNGTKALADLDPLTDRDRVFEVRQPRFRACYCH